MKLNVVTHNPGKVKEYQAEFADFGVEMVHVNREYDEVQTAYLEEVVDKAWTCGRTTSTFIFRF